MHWFTLRPVAALVMVLTVTAAACGDGNGIVLTPTAPTLMPAPRPTFSLFGVISEVTATGTVPLEGVMMEVASCDPNASRGCPFDKRVTTDEHGSYIVEGLYAGAAGVWVEKIGFRLSDGVKVNGEGVQTVLIDNDTRFDILLVRR